MNIDFYAANEPRPKQLMAALLQLWQRSVRATHHFLTTQDIERLAPFCREGMQQVHLYVANVDGVPVAFMGLSGDKIEMLFVSPDCFRMGLDKKLIALAINEHHVSRVDVNEQNPNALAFYQEMGFHVFERTPTDEQGNPFPILKMRL